jgi:hypothetical protein
MSIKYESDFTVTEIRIAFGEVFQGAEPFSEGEYDIFHVMQVYAFTGISVTDMNLCNLERIYDNMSGIQN